MIVTTTKTFKLEASHKTTNVLSRLPSLKTPSLRTSGQRCYAAFLNFVFQHRLWSLVLGDCHSRVPEEQQGSPGNVSNLRL